jgi:hypothetical protein
VVLHADAHGPGVQRQIAIGRPPELHRRLRHVQLAIRYDRTTNIATYRAVVGTDSLPAIRSALHNLASPTGTDAAAQGPNSQAPQQRGQYQDHPASPRFPSAWCPRPDPGQSSEAWYG